MDMDTLKLESETGLNSASLIKKKNGGTKGALYVQETGV